MSRHTTTVVTFTPPPVEPGPAPMNISTMVRRPPPLVSLARSTVLNPAVRGDTAWNRAARACCPAVMPDSRLSRSASQNRAVPPTVRTRVAVSISLECRE